MGYNGDSASVGGDLASLPSLAREGKVAKCARHLILLPESASNCDVSGDSRRHFVAFVPTGITAHPTTTINNTQTPSLFIKHNPDSTLIKHLGHKVIFRLLALARLTHKDKPGEGQTVPAVVGQVIGQ